jgi:hypothetical protein
MTEYGIQMCRHQCVLYLAAEFGTRGALRILRGVAPFGETEAPFTMLTKQGPWYIYNTAMFQKSGRHTKRNANNLMRRMAEFIAHQEGKLQQPLRGSAGIMSIVEI